MSFHIRIQETRLYIQQALFFSPVFPPLNSEFHKEETLLFPSTFLESMNNMDQYSKRVYLERFLHFMLVFLAATDR